jgi:multidrug resistance efflux pump
MSDANSNEKQAMEALPVEEQVSVQEKADENTQAQTDSRIAEYKLVRKMTIRVLAVSLVFFGWYVAADRMTPNTNQARVRGHVVPMAPQVSGIVTEVNVEMNQAVKKGQVLVKIDPDNYELAVKQA